MVRKSIAKGEIS